VLLPCNRRRWKDDRSKEYSLATDEEGRHPKGGSHGTENVVFTSKAKLTLRETMMMMMIMVCIAKN